MIKVFRRRVGGGLGIGVLLLLCGLACQRRATPTVTAEKIRQPGEPAVASPAQIQENGYGFTSEEEAAVADFLRRHPDLRMATDADRRGARSGDGDVRGLYGVYHPYFVRGDINDDGILDFVLAFVHRGSNRTKPLFSVVVFTGGGRNGEYNPGTFLERDILLAHGDLSIDRDAILITPDLSDEAVRRYRWDPVHRSYVFVRDEEEDDEMPVPTQV